MRGSRIARLELHLENKASASPMAAALRRARPQRQWRRQHQQSQIPWFETMTRIDDTKAVKERATRGVARRLFRVLSGPRERQAGVLFHPVGNLQPETTAGHWRSEGFDSYFYVPIRCEAGPLLVSFDATLCGTGIDHRDHWRLYFDTGEGFREEDSLVIACSGARIEIETTISLPAPALAFRIDPCEQSGRFVLHKLALTPLAVSQPPSDNIPHQSLQLHRLGALLRRMAASARLAQRRPWRRQRQSTVPLPPASAERGA